MTNPLFEALLARHRDSDAALIVQPDGRIWTYGEMLALAARFANALAALGARPGNRVAVQVEKTPEALAVYLACIWGGFVLLPLNPAYSAREVGYFMADATPRVLICDPALRAGLAPVMDGAIVTLGVDGQGGFAALAAGQSEQCPVVARRDDDLAAILYTSGTTGRPKGAMLSQTNLLSNARVLCEAWRFTWDDVLLHALPIFHTHGLFVAVNITLLAGGSMIFLPRFDADAVVRCLPQATAMMAVPTFYVRLLGCAAFGPGVAHNMRLFISGSAPLLAETHAAFEARCGHRILERYGMTETSMNTSNPYEGRRRAGTVGSVLAGVEARVVDSDTGEALPSGQVGILLVRGPNVFLGYWNMPEETREALLEDGFFVTGDLAVIGEDGYVEIVGRAKDMIISGGLNVYPKEVEAVIDGVSGVAESAVIGVPDDDLGEAGLAFVVREAGAKLDAASISAALSEQLARYKLPRKIAFVDELPRNSMGKVQKNRLWDYS